MTIRIGTDAQGHHSHSFRQSRLQLPTYKTGKEPQTHVGINRQPDRKPVEKPLTENHLKILQMVDIEDPISSREIAEVLKLKRATVESGLYALAKRGLVERIQQKGWVKAGTGDVRFLTERATTDSGAS